MTPPRIYGLLGYPVKHSFSPAMHSAAFKALNINAEYRLFEKKPEELDSFLNSLSQENISGLNVTIPYKEKILSFVKLNRQSLYLRQVKAINTIVKEFGVWVGFNTDIPGFSRDLKENVNPANIRAAILGAGGAARAVAYVLANSGAKDISLYDIDKIKCQNLADMIRSLFRNFKIHPVETIEELKIKEKDLLINATPVGMKETDPCLIKEEMLHKDLFVYDLIYNPPETKLLSLAKKIGAKTSSGLRMLLYQGMLSFEKWIGVGAPQEIMWQALKEEFKKCKRYSQK